MIAVLLVSGCAKKSFEKPARTDSSGDSLFVWERPVFPSPKLPIKQSATCRFKKGLGVSFERLKTEPATAPERIYYSVSDENELDPVAFVDLNTPTPKVQTNGGQASLNILYDDGQTIALLANESAGRDLYTIFRNKGIVIYTQQKDSPFIGPFGVVMMGYCY